MHTEQALRSKVLVAGHVVDGAAIRRDPTPFQHQLREAKTEHGSAKCLCSKPELALVVREMRGKLFLAAWPNDADRHAVDCPFFSEAASGARLYGPQAIVPEGDRTHLAMARPLVSDESTSERGRAASRASGTERIQLWGLIHYLWESAGLNRWYPGWKRDWGFARSVLRRAAEKTEVEGRPLLERLYIPPVWTPQRKDTIRGYWREFCAPLQRDARGSTRVAAGIVIGMVREVSEEGGRIELRLVHHGEPLLVDRHAAEDMARYSRRGWNAAKRLEPEGPVAERPHVIALLRVEATRTGRILVVDGVLVRVSQRFIPVNHAGEDRIALELVETDREFSRPLHYDNRGVALPSFVLRDAASTEHRFAHRVALHIYGATLGEAQRAALRTRDQSAALQAGIGYWEWHAGRDSAPPHLPARASGLRAPTSFSPPKEKVSLP